MKRKVEFRETSNLGRGNFIAVIVDKVTVGRIQLNNANQWCYFTGPNEPSAEIANRDLAAVKAAVTERLSR